MKPAITKLNFIAEEGSIRLCLDYVNWWVESLDGTVLEEHEVYKSHEHVTQYLYDMTHLTLQPLHTN